MLNRSASEFSALYADVTPTTSASYYQAHNTDDYDIVAHLGAGFFGDVYKVRHSFDGAIRTTKHMQVRHKVSGTILAMRRLYANEQCVREYLRDSLSVLLHINHAHVLHLSAVAVEGHGQNVDGNRRANEKKINHLVL